MKNIELVIKIPHQMYQKIKETNMFISGRRSGRRFDYILFNAVNTGTPLPKGHGALIDVDKLIGKIHGVRSITAVLDAPTIIEADKAESEEGESE